MSELLPKSGDRDLWERIRPALETMTRPYPLEAIRAAQAAREAVTPHLLDAIERLARDHSPALDRDYTLHLHAICLLAEFRETRAYRPLVELATQAEPVAEELFGDFTGEILGRALASVCDGDIVPLETLIDDEAVSIWIRIAAVSAIAVRALEGDADPAQAVAWLLRWGEQEAARLRALPPQESDSTLLDFLVSSICDVGAGPALPAIRGWYAEELADDNFMRLSAVEEEALCSFEELRSKCLARNQGYVRDAVGEMRHWHCFTEASLREDEDALEYDFGEPPGPYIRPAPKIGRNEPCPCGSGKKYKKCCGAPA